MIDLHCHILPGLDDGPPSMDESLNLARASVKAGMRTVVATPHIRDDYPFDPAEIAPRTALLNRALVQHGIDLEVIPGAEVAVSMVAELDDPVLANLCLGQGPYLLIESPYTYVADLLESTLFDLQLRGFRPILAHPERSPCFIDDLRRLADAEGRGILCSVTAGSMAAQFGRHVARATRTMFVRGLVHNVATDAHGARTRTPSLWRGFEALNKELPGLIDQAGWYTEATPAAILAGAAMPPRPQRALGGRRWVRFFKRSDNDLSPGGTAGR